MLLYVDDILLACNNDEFLKHVKFKLCETFKISRLGIVNNFLGISIKRSIDNLVIILDQSQSIQILAKRFHVDKFRTFKTPIEKKMILNKNMNEYLKTKLLYKELLGSLMYIMMGSRPDICFSINYFGQFQDCNRSTFIKNY